MKGKWKDDKEFLILWRIPSSKLPLSLLMGTLEIEWAASYKGTQVYNKQSLQVREEIGTFISFLNFLHFKAFTIFPRKNDFITKNFSFTLLSWRSLSIYTNGSIELLTRALSTQRSDLWKYRSSSWNANAK